MESIDAMRDWWRDRFPVMDEQLGIEFRWRIEAIESEVKANRVDAYTEGYDAGFASADDLAAQHEDAMAEHGWVRLPVDADGVPIHVGDLMEVSNGRRDEVRFLTLNEDGWAFNEKGWVPNWSHHHAPTVEDVLREFALACEDAGNAGPEVERIAAEFAAKLRLAGDE